MSNEAGYTMSATGQDSAVDALFPSTPTIKKEAPQPDAHRGRIDGVTSTTFDSGATAIKIALTSLDEGFTTEHTIFVPAGFVQDIKVDPNTLPEGTTVIDEVTGKSKQKGNQQQQYARTIRNSAGDAEIQKLYQIGQNQGLVGAVTPPTNFSGFVSALSQALTGAQVIFRRAADKNAANPQFADVLRVKAILDISEVSNPKRFKGVRKAWD